MKKKTVARHGSAGFTLIELLVAGLMVSALMAVSAFAAQRYALRQQLNGMEQTMVTELRELQQRAVAVSHPSVFGAWLSVAPDSDWGPVEFIPDDPSLSGNQTDCRPRGIRNFDSGPFDAGELTLTIVDGFDPDDLTYEIDPDPTDPSDSPMNIGAYCASRISQADRFIFFFSRGDATGGTFRLTHPRLDLSRDISVASLTGRVVGTE